MLSMTTSSLPPPPPYSTLQLLTYHLMTLLVFHMSISIVFRNLCTPMCVHKYLRKRGEKLFTARFVTRGEDEDEAQKELKGNPIAHIIVKVKKIREKWLAKQFAFTLKWLFFARRNRACRGGGISSFVISVMRVNEQHEIYSQFCDALWALFESSHCCWMKVFWYRLEASWAFEKFRWWRHLASFHDRLCNVRFKLEKLLEGHGINWIIRNKT